MKLKDESVEIALNTHIRINGRQLKNGDLCFTAFKDGILVLLMKDD